MQLKNNSNTMNTSTPYILAFDLGTTKIIGAVVQKTTEGKLSIVAYEEEEISQLPLKQGLYLMWQTQFFIINSIVTKLRNKTKLNPNQSIYYWYRCGYLRYAKKTKTKRTLGYKRNCRTKICLINCIKRTLNYNLLEFDILDVITQNI